MLDKIKWFWKYYRRHLYVLMVLLLLTPIQAVFQVAIPKMFGFTVDYMQTEQVPSDWLANLANDLGGKFNLSPTESFGWGFIVLGLIATILYTIVQSHRAWMNCRMEMLFRQDTFSDTTFKGPDFFNKFRTGDLVTRLTDDVAEKLSWFACSGIFRLYEALLNIAFILVMMITIDPVLTLWTAGPLPLLIVIFFLTASTLDKRYAHLQSRISNFNDIMEACYSGIRVVMAYVREDFQKDKFREAAEDRRAAEISAVRITTIVDSLYMYIWQFGLVIVLIAGGYMVIKSNLSYGNMAVFIYYVVWLVFPMFDIGQFLVKSRQSIVSINRLMEIANVPDMVSDEGKIPANRNIHGGLSFENVVFSFPESDRKIVDGISFDIKPGQTVALVGRVGSGKTWLINMIPRLINPTGGSIKLDGHDLHKFKLEDLRKNIGYVPQEPILFSDTVRNNIIFGREEISESVLEWAVDVAQLKNEIANFPKGLDTEIGTRGMSISGGQKQRLALARALVGKPKLLILDDCTSALDSRTESTLWERLHEVLPDMTAILITHRPDTLERADNIYVLENGKITESGRHHELMSKPSKYASIYKRFQLEEAVNK